MKTKFFFITALSLVQLAVSQPHRKIIISLHVSSSLTVVIGPHQHKHGKRQDVVTDVTTDVAYVTMDTEDVVVYVNENGQPVSTSTRYRNHPGPTTAPSSSSTSAPESTPTASYQPPVSKAAGSSPPPPPPPPSSAPSSASSSAPVQSSSPPTGPSGGGPGFSSGASYSPYNADNSCKSTSQVASDFQSVSGYEVVRLYGTDCNQVANVIAATKGKNLKLFLGIFDLGSIADECKTITSAVNGDWSIVNTVSVGNELVNNGGASVDQVTAAIGQAKSTLKAAGYNGPVVTVDTMLAMKTHPELCHASDYCAINCHAFFDGNVSPENAGDFVLSWAKQVSEAAGGKTTVVTETGWPTQGETNKKAVPSKENQQKAIESIKGALTSNVVLYNLFNDAWKKDRADTFGAERFWGILGDAPA